MSSTLDTVGIIGYGRFGKILERLLASNFDISIYDTRLKETSLTKVLNARTLFIATPIHTFESVIQLLASKLKPGTTIIDVCSVKSYPVKIMEKYLPDTIDIIATHPMFGPDSIDSKERLNFVMHKVRDQQNTYTTWKAFFAKNFNIVELTPDEHDRLAANSQSVIHFIARMLEAFDLQPTPIDTQGCKNLLRLVANNCKDTWDLFYDLQTYNPYATDMLDRLETAFKKTREQLTKPG